LWFGSLLLLVGLCTFVYLGVRVIPELGLRLQKRILSLIVLAGVIMVVAQLRNATLGLTSPSGPDGTLGTMVESLILEGSAIVCLLLATYYLFRSEREEISALRHSANVDPLTSLHNQAYFRRAASRRIAQAREYDIPLSLAMLNLDDFKDYNDVYGHEAGNAVLKNAANIVKSSMRADDLVARYGGEEFIVLLSCGRSQAEAVLERIRTNIEAFCAPESARERVTISIGISSLTEGMNSVEDFIETADAALYRAKSAGKNCVITSNEAA
ncbi:MAG: GGDEF domain-containing protein, partial [Rubrobacter sp.]